MTDRKEVLVRVLHIEKQLAVNNYDDISNHLTELESTNVTVEHLQETEAVRAIYMVLKRCPSVLLKKKAKHLLSKWKNIYRSHYHDSKQNQKEMSAKNEKGKNGILFVESQVETSEELHSQSVLNLTSPSSLNTLNNEDLYNVPDRNINAVHEGTPGSQLGLVDYDKSLQQKQTHLLDMRTKCTDLLYQALVHSTAWHGTKDAVTQKLAKEIEEHIFSAHTANEKKYKICIRSKVLNLKNQKNPHLSERLISGTLSPKAFVGMTAMEMANDELKRVRASYTESSVLEHQLPQNMEGTTTNRIKCRRCENFNCTVTVISRGTLFLPGWVQNGKPDDELMTFVICNVCGEKWYNNGWVPL